MCVRRACVCVSYWPPDSCHVCIVSLSHTSLSLLLSGQHRRQRRNEQECAKWQKSISLAHHLAERYRQRKNETMAARERILAQGSIFSRIDAQRQKKQREKKNAFTMQEIEVQGFRLCHCRAVLCASMMRMCARVHFILYCIEVVRYQCGCVCVCELHARHETVNAHFREEKEEEKKQQKPTQTPNKKVNWFALTPKRKCTFGSYVNA